MDEIDNTKKRKSCIITISTPLSINNFYEMYKGCRKYTNGSYVYYETYTHIDCPGVSEYIKL